MEKRFTGKSVMVVGCAQGIGMAVAEGFAKEGARLAMYDIQDKVDETKERIRNEYNVEEIFSGRVDISDYDSCVAAVNEVKEKFGQIDVIAILSGILPKEGNVPNTPVDMWRRVIDVNLTGTFCMGKAVSQVMMEQGHGNIIFTGSGWGHVGEPNFASYSCSKAGVIKLTQSMAVELADYGIRVNNICPGSTNTEMHKAAIAADAEKRGISIEEMKKIDYVRMAMKRPGEPSELADAYLYLASDQSSYITGISLDVNGGGYFH